MFVCECLPIRMCLCVFVCESLPVCCFISCIAWTVVSYFIKARGARPCVQKYVLGKDHYSFLTVVPKGPVIPSAQHRREVTLRCSTHVFRSLVWVVLIVKLTWGSCASIPCGLIFRTLHIKLIDLTFLWFLNTIIGFVFVETRDVYSVFKP